MSLHLQTDEMFSGFVAFGDWMDATTRKQLARLLVHRLFEPEWDYEPSFRSLRLHKKAPIWEQALRQILEAEGLVKLTAHNEALALSVARHSLDWLRHTHQQAEAESPNRNQLLQIREWQKQLTTTASNWQKLIVQLSEFYPEKDRSWRFFGSQLTDEDGRQQILLRQNILEEWTAILHERQDDFVQSYVGKAFERFENDLRHRYTLLNQLGDYISPFLHMLGENEMHLADSWNAMPWSDIESYVSLLENDPHIKALLEELGRWEAAEDDLREASLADTPLQTEWKPKPYGRSEIIGINYSDQIESVLPAELGLLSHPETEVLLAKKYVEKKLLTFQHRSIDKDTIPRLQPTLEGSSQKGPIILCVDTSGSMFGQPELVAKAIAFALTSRALKEKRPCYLISFSTDYKTLELTSLKGNMQQLMDFLKMSFHGGTDIRPAMQQALDMLKEGAFVDADVLVLSDFILPRVPQHMLDEIQKQRAEHSTSFHSLYISRRIDPRTIPASVFDHQWVYNLSHASGLHKTVGAVNSWLD